MLRLSVQSKDNNKQIKTKSWHKWHPVQECFFWGTYIYSLARNLGFIKKEELIMVINVFLIKQRIIKSISEENESNAREKQASLECTSVLFATNTYMIISKWKRNQRNAKKTNVQTGIRCVHQTMSLVYRPTDRDLALRHLQQLKKQLQLINWPINHIV